MTLAARINDEPIDRRFFAKVKPAAGGCLEWTAAKTQGYGSFGIGGSGNTMSAHRWIWQRLNGPIPSGLELDHICRNRACVYVRHLRLVTHRQNVLCGEGIAARNAAKKKCKNGHPLSGGNLYLYPRGGRACRTCTQASRERYAAKHR